MAAALVRPNNALIASDVRSARGLGVVTRPVTRAPVNPAASQPSGLASLGRRAPRTTRTAARRTFAAEVTVQRSAKELVDELLQLIGGTDGGASVDGEKRQRIEALVLQLSEQGIDEPLKSPLIFGEWEVGYTSKPTAAGGYYRGLLGRALLKTEEMVQTISEPDVVGNRVVFQALSAVPGKVSLKGTLRPLDAKWVEVTFEPPQLALGPWEFTYGGESKVRLAVTYLDERVRLGRGSQGSTFAFVRRVAS